MSAQASFHVADKTVSIDEPPVENSGGFGGRVFLKKCRLANSSAGGRNFEATDFVVGRTLRIAGRDFVVLDADKSTRDFFKATFPSVRDV